MKPNSPPTRLVTPAAERGYAVISNEEAKHRLAAHAGRLAVVVNPGFTQHEDVVFRGIARTLAGRFALYESIQISAHQSYDSLLNQFTSSHPAEQQGPTMQLAAERLQQELACEHAPMSQSNRTVNGVYLPVPGAALSQGLLLAADSSRHNLVTSAHVAVITTEELSTIGIPETADHGDAFVLNTNHMSDNLAWKHMYQTPLNIDK